jgi:hypothetical protein
MSWIGPAISIAGGLMAGESARGAAEATAKSNIEAARIAAEAAKFRPIGFRTRVGKSEFTRGPSGYIESAGYTTSPEYQAYQDQLSQMLGQQIQQGLGAQQQYAPLTGAATGLFNLGQQYLAQSPQEAAQKYMESQQALLAPSRERESALLANQLANTGRTGLAVAQGGGLLSANPEQAALANARALQDLQLAAQATQAGQQQALFGAGLFGQGAGLLGQYQQGQIGALSPFQSTLGVQSGIEQLAQQPLLLGAGLGGQQAAYGANAGRYTMLGQQMATPYQYDAASYNPLGYGLMRAGMNPQLTSALSKLFGGGYQLGTNPWGFSGNEPLGGFSPSGVEYFAG